MLTALCTGTTHSQVFQTVTLLHSGVVCIDGCRVSPVYLAWPMTAPFLSATLHGIWLSGTKPRLVGSVTPAVRANFVGLLTEASPGSGH